MAGDGRLRLGNVKITGAGGVKHKDPRKGIIEYKWLKNSKMERQLTHSGAGSDPASLGLGPHSHFYPGVWFQRNPTWSYMLGGSVSWLLECFGIPVDINI